MHIVEKQKRKKRFRYSDQFLVAASHPLSRQHLKSKFSKDCDSKNKHDVTFMDKLGIDHHRDNQNVAFISINREWKDTVTWHLQMCASFLLVSNEQLQIFFFLRQNKLGNCRYVSLASVPAVHAGPNTAHLQGPSMVLFRRHSRLASERPLHGRRQAAPWYGRRFSTGSRLRHVP